MIQSAILWWKERAPRERLLLSAMLALLAAIILWFGVVRPIESGLVSVREDYRAALDRNAAVRARVQALDRAPPRRGPGAAKPLQQRIADSAAEAGFTLGSSNAIAGGGVQISIGSARPAAFFGWIATLESQGITVRTLSAAPAGVGTITVSAVLNDR